MLAATASIKSNTAYKASKMSFVDLFIVEKYIDDKMSRWKFVLRVKRGLMDTAEPGGH